MKKKLQISKMIASAALAVAAVAPSFGQTNLGAACGCPPVANRTTVLLSSLPGFTAINGTYGGELTSGAVLTCDKTYIIDQKIYVDSLQTLTIAPGTILKGRLTPDVVGSPGTVDKAKATALIVERGAKIIADGTADCQIVFTAEADPLDGTYSVANYGKWGGLVILGTATNNLTLGANGPFVPGGSGKLAVANGLGTIEGFATSNTQDQYGVNLTAGQSFNDNDNSGILRYVSVRHAGAVLSVGAEINGITLGSVGRGTTLEHIEIVSCADDNVEFFGGTANIKYLSTLFGNDDMVDYDLGWSGKAQFIFGMMNLSSSPDADNGIEADSDDNKSNLNPKSIPVLYNLTMIGNNKTVKTSDESAFAAINAKELTGGEIYNSVFANFNYGFNVVKSVGTVRTGTSEAYHNWSTANGNGSNILKVKCNTFVGVTNPLTVGSSAANVVQADNDQFAADGNVVVAGNNLPGFDYSFTINNTTNAVTVKNDVTPNPGLSIAGCPTAPIDGFYRAANYRGAFSPNANENWLSNWSYSQVLGATKGIVACPTDINADGKTNVNDFLQLVNEFGKDCN